MNIRSLLLFAGLFCVGCGGNTLRAQATALQITGVLADTACEEVRLAREHEQDEAVTHSPTRDTAQAAVDAVRARYEPALLACTLTATAHDTWFEAVSLAVAGAPLTAADGFRLAGNVLALWPRLAEALRAVGVTLPALPQELQLVGGSNVAGE
jgi:hypothetical protein